MKNYLSPKIMMKMRRLIWNKKWHYINLRRKTNKSMTCWKRLSMWMVKLKDSCSRQTK